MTTHNFTIDSEKQCSRCGMFGASSSGLCLDCAAKTLMQPDRTEIKKIKSKDGRIEITWNVYRGDSEDPDNYSLNCIEEARPAFYAALSALAVHAASICELPMEYAARIGVSGVTFSWAHGIMGATITGLMVLMHSNAPLVLNTPHKPAEPYSDGGDGTGLLDPDTVQALKLLIEEAEAYIRGERKYQQMDMFKEPAYPLKDTREAVNA